jgi:hypothetical protein
VFLCEYKIQLKLLLQNAILNGHLCCDLKLNLMATNILRFTDAQFRFGGKTDIEKYYVVPEMWTMP